MDTSADPYYARCNNEETESWTNHHVLTISSSYEEGQDYGEALLINNGNFHTAYVELGHTSAMAVCTSFLLLLFHIVRFNQHQCWNHTHCSTREGRYNWIHLAEKIKMKQDNVHNKNFKKIMTKKAHKCSSNPWYIPKLKRQMHCANEVFVRCTTQPKLEFQL